MLIIIKQQKGALPEKRITSKIKEIISKYFPLEFSSFDLEKIVKHNINMIRIPKEIEGQIDAADEIKEGKNYLEAFFQLEGELFLRGF